jgi:hypothetical protein
MRRILLGGLGLALGAFAPPALAQHPTSSPPARAATLGRPTALPDAGAPAPAPTDPNVTPAAGVLRPRFGPPAGAPTGVQPGTGVPTAMPPARGSDGAPPKVIETRDPTGRIPTGSMVPSVVPAGPDVVVPCTECAVPGAETPMFGARPALNRLAGFGRSWVSAEVLLWWGKSQQVPALVTTSSPQFNGIVGQGDTRVLLGGSFGETFHTGGRIGFGRWFDENECRGLDGRLFWVAPATSSFAAGVPPFGLLARPFVNVNPTTAPSVNFGQTSEVVAGPGVATGMVRADVRSTVWGADLNYRRYLWGDAGFRVDGLVGYRYLGLRDELTITENFTRVPNSDMTVGTPAVFGTIQDRFRTENDFHGGQVGFTSTLNRGRWSVDTRATLAFGTVFQEAEINGFQQLTFANGGVQTVQGGLLAVPGTNIGTFRQTRFAVVPEVGVNIGWQATERMKLFVGYNFLYLSSALRPGGVIDQNVDAARVPNFAMNGAPLANPIRPVPIMNPTGYFVQGISFGMVYRW